MGAHFRSIQVRAKKRDAILTAIADLIQRPEDRFLVGPSIDGWVGIYPKEEVPAEKFAASLAAKLEDAVILELIIHHSDILFYNFFRNGRLVDEYSSNPDYFEEVAPAERHRLKGKPEIFRDLLGSEQQVAKIAGFLHSKDKKMFLFEENRLEKVAELLGIANTLTSYEYLTEGEWDGISGRKQFVHVPDLAAEKSAARKLAAALRAEWRRLKQGGILCFESMPPGKGAIMSGEAVIDPLHKGIVFEWGIHGRIPDEPPLLRAGPAWMEPPHPVEIPDSSNAPKALVFSCSGNWFAYTDNELRLWNWPQKKLVASVGTNWSPVQFSGDEKFLLCRNAVGFGLFSLEDLKFEPPITTGSQSPHFLAWHPDGRYVVIRPRQEQIGIVDLSAGKLIKTLFSGAVSDHSSLASMFSDRLKKAGVPQAAMKQWAEGFIRGSYQYFSCKFSLDGNLLFCATTDGLHVLEWDKVLAAEQTTPRPLHLVSPQPLTPPDPFAQTNYQNYIYDVAYDHPANRLLFCGIEGVIRFLNLSDRSTGVLLKPPGQDSIWRIQMSPDREYLCCYCTPTADDRNRKPQSIRVWNYRLLRSAVGLA